MAAVSPWFAMTRMLIEIRTLRARMETPRTAATLPEDNQRNPVTARPSNAR